MLIFKLKGVEKIDIVDLIFMGIPEGFVFYILKFNIRKKDEKNTNILYDIDILYFMLFYKK